MKAIIFAGAMCTLLTVAKAALPNVFWFLPLGGSAAAELGIVLGFALAVATILSLITGKADE